MMPRLSEMTGLVLVPYGRVVRFGRLEFEPWTGAPVPDHDLGAKPVVDLGGRPLFAELAVLTLLRAEGWSGCWVDSFRQKYRVAMPPSDPIELPVAQEGLLSRIRERTGRWGGCWDVFAWRGGEHVFVELKRAHSTDRIRESQLEFLEAALGLGVPADAFYLVEWTFLK